MPPLPARRIVAMRTANTSPAQRLQWCDCDAAPASLRRALIAQVTREAPAPAAERRLVLTDMDAGKLKQTAHQLDALVAAGHRNLEVNLVEAHFPAAACGTYHLSDTGWHRTPPASCPPGPAVSGWVGDRLDRSTRHSVVAFLQHARDLARSHGLRLVLHLHRSVGGLLAAVAHGDTTPGDAIVGVDLQAASPHDDPRCRLQAILQAAPAWARGYLLAYGRIARVHAGQSSQDRSSQKIPS